MSGIFGGSRRERINYELPLDLGVEIPVVNFVNHVIGTITIYDSGFVHKESTSCTN